MAILNWRLGSSSYGSRYGTGSTSTASSYLSALNRDRSSSRDKSGYGSDYTKSGYGSGTGSTPYTSRYSKTGSSDSVSGITSIASKFGELKSSPRSRDTSTSGSYLPPSSSSFSSKAPTNTNSSYSTTRSRDSTGLSSSIREPTTSYTSRTRDTGLSSSRDTGLSSSRDTIVPSRTRDTNLSSPRTKENDFSSNRTKESVNDSSLRTRDGVLNRSRTNELPITPSKSESGNTRTGSSSYVPRTRNLPTSPSIPDSGTTKTGFSSYGSRARDLPTSPKIQESGASRTGSSTYVPRSRDLPTSPSKLESGNSKTGTSAYVPKYSSSNYERSGYNSDAKSGYGSDYKSGYGSGYGSGTGTYKRYSWSRSNSFIKEPESPTTYRPYSRENSYLGNDATSSGSNWRSRIYGHDTGTEQSHSRPRPSTLSVTADSNEKTKKEVEKEDPKPQRPSAFQTAIDKLSQDSKENAFKEEKKPDILLSPNAVKVLPNIVLGDVKLKNKAPADFSSGSDSSDEEENIDKKEQNGSSKLTEKPVNKVGENKTATTIKRETSPVETVVITRPLRHLGAAPPLPTRRELPSSQGLAPTPAFKRSAKYETTLHEIARTAPSSTWLKNREDEDKSPSPRNLSQNNLSVIEQGGKSPSKSPPADRKNYLINGTVRNASPNIPIVENLGIANKECRKSVLNMDIEPEDQETMRKKQEEKREELRRLRRHRISDDSANTQDTKADDGRKQISRIVEGSSGTGDKLKEEQEDSQSSDDEKNDEKPPPAPVVERVSSKSKIVERKHSKGKGDSAKRSGSFRRQRERKISQTSKTSSTSSSSDSESETKNKVRSGSYVRVRKRGSRDDIISKTTSREGIVEGLRSRNNSESIPMTNSRGSVSKPKSRNNSRGSLADKSNNNSKNSLIGEKKLTLGPDIDIGEDSLDKSPTSVRKSSSKNKQIVGTNSKEKIIDRIVGLDNEIHPRTRKQVRASSTSSSSESSDDDSSESAGEEGCLFSISKSRSIKKSKSTLNKLSASPAKMHSDTAADIGERTSPDGREHVSRSNSFRSQEENEKLQNGSPVFETSFKLIIPRLYDKSNKSCLSNKSVNVELSIPDIPDGSLANSRSTLSSRKSPCIDNNDDDVNESANIDISDSLELSKNDLEVNFTSKDSVESGKSDLEATFASKDSIENSNNELDADFKSNEEIVSQETFQWPEGSPQLPRKKVVISVKEEYIEPSKEIDEAEDAYIFQWPDGSPENSQRTRYLRTQWDTETETEMDQDGSDVSPPISKCPMLPVDEETEDELAFEWPSSPELSRRHPCNSGYDTQGETEAFEWPSSPEFPVMKDPKFVSFTTDIDSILNDGKEEESFVHMEEKLGFEAENEKKIEKDEIDEENEAEKKMEIDNEKEEECVEQAPHSLKNRARKNLSLFIDDLEHSKIDVEADFASKESLENYNNNLEPDNASKDALENFNYYVEADFASNDTLENYNNNLDTDNASIHSLKNNKNDLETCYASKQTDFQINEYLDSNQNDSEVTTTQEEVINKSKYDLEAVVKSKEALENNKTYLEEDFLQKGSICNSKYDLEAHFESKESLENIKNESELKSKDSTESIKYNFEDNLKSSDSFENIQNNLECILSLKDSLDNENNDLEAGFTPQDFLEHSKNDIEASFKTEDSLENNNLDVDSVLKEEVTPQEFEWPLSSPELPRKKVVIAVPEEYLETDDDAAESEDAYIFEWQDDDSPENIQKSRYLRTQWERETEVEQMDKLDISPPISKCHLQTLDEETEDELEFEWPSSPELSRHHAYFSDYDTQGENETFDWPSSPEIPKMKDPQFVSFTTDIDSILNDGKEEESFGHMEEKLGFKTEKEINEELDECDSELKVESDEIKEEECKLSTPHSLIDRARENLSLFIGKLSNIDEIIGSVLQPLTSGISSKQKSRKDSSDEEGKNKIGDMLNLRLTSVPEKEKNRIASSNKIYSIKNNCNSSIQEIDVSHVKVHDAQANRAEIDENIEEIDASAVIIRKMEKREALKAEIIKAVKDGLDDATLQVYRDGDYGTYLDLESSLAEQADDIDGLTDSKKNAIILRTQLSVRVHAIIEKLLNSDGRELRRALFSLKQIFQDDKDLVHAFVQNDGLKCLVKVGVSADHNYQTYILRALGQVMLYVDGMTGISNNPETLQWLYTLVASRFRLVVKTALKLLLVFVEYSEFNSMILIKAIESVDKAKGERPWSIIMRLLEGKECPDTELQIYAMTLVNKTLNGLPDQDSYYDQTDSLEEQGIEILIQKLLHNPNSDLDLLQQLTIYEAVLAYEDGDDVCRTRTIDPTIRQGLRYSATDREDSNRRKSRRHYQSPSPELNDKKDDGLTSSDDEMRGHVTVININGELPIDDLGGIKHSDAGVTPALRRRRERAERQKTFLNEQEMLSESRRDSQSDTAGNVEDENRKNNELSWLLELMQAKKDGEVKDIAARIASLMDKENIDSNKKLPIELTADSSVKDILEKLSRGASLTVAEHEKLTRLGDVSGRIQKAKGDLLNKSHSKGEVRALKALEPPKKSENDLHWENLVAHLNRNLELCDLDFTDLTEEDDKDIYSITHEGIPPPPPPPPPPMIGGIPQPINGYIPPPPPVNGCIPPPPPVNGCIPPPPPPQENGHAAVDEDGNVIPQEQMNGIPMAPPPIGFNAFKHQKTKKTIKLFWKEIRDDLLRKSKTVWDTIDPVSVDIQKLEHLFESRAKDLTTKKQQDHKGIKEVIVLDSKRSNVINIGMTKLPPPRTIKTAILKMDSSIINREGIEKLLLTMLPTADEKKMIQDAAMSNPELPLGSAEQFLMMLASISELPARLKLWLFKLDFENMEKEVAEPLMDLKQGIADLQKSRTFAIIISILLSVGNFLNGTDSKGFQIDYLSKVPEVKDTVHKHSLLHHLCHMVIEKYPETTDLYSELGSITRASKVDFDELQNMIEKMETECKASWDHLKAIAKHDGPTQMKLKMSEFLADGAERIIVLGIIYRRIMHRFQRFLMWLGMPPNVVLESKAQTTCSVLSEFALEYRTCRERVLQQIQKKASHRERNKTRGKMITEMEKFKSRPKTKEEEADSDLRQLLNYSDMSDTETIRGKNTWRRTREGKTRSRGEESMAEMLMMGADGVDDALLDSLVKTATQAPPTRSTPRERKRSRHADRKSLKRSRTRDRNLINELEALQATQQILE